MPPSPESEKLAEKIKKLIALATPRDDGVMTPEMQTAWAKAQQMMVEHGIAQADLKEATARIEISQMVCSLHRRRDYHDTFVLGLLMNLFNVVCVQTMIPVVTEGGKYDKHLGVIIVGQPDDVELAKNALPTLMETFDRGFKSWLCSQGYTWSAARARGYHAGAYAGFLRCSEDGMAAAFRQYSRDKIDQYALAVRDKKQANRDWIEQNMPGVEFMGPNLKEKEIDKEAIERGYQDGKRITLNKKLK